MATYLEIKQLLAEVFSIREIDETCDLILFEAPAPQNNVVLQNETLLQSYNQIETYSQDKLEMYTNKFREVALQTAGPIYRTINIVEQRGSKRRRNAALCLLVDLLLTDYSDVLYYYTCFMPSFCYNYFKKSATNSKIWVVV